MSDNFSKIDFTDRIEIRTQNPDLGATIFLWLAQDLLNFMFRQSKKVILEDGSSFSAVIHGDHLLIQCPPDFFSISISPVSRLFRKIKIKMKREKSPFILRHDHVVYHYLSTLKTLRETLRPAAPQPCRFLLRVDDFPSMHRSSSEFLRFHDFAVEMAIPYLLAVTPFLDQGKGPTPLSDYELKILHQCVKQGVSLALHGFTHKNRIQKYNSELVSMPETELEDNIQKALAYFQTQQLPVSGFVAPFNTYDPKTLPVIAKHFSFFCGGPESILSLGNRVGPSFFRQSLYLPSYNGLYDIDESQLPLFDSLSQNAQGFVLPIALHWANEVRNHLQSFRFLISKIKNQIMPWENFVTFASHIQRRKQ